MTSVLYPRMAVIGCGLVGGSVVRAARHAGVVGEIAVAEINPVFRARLAELDIADLLTGDAREAVAGADLVVLATFPSALEEAAREIGPHLKPGATITDVGSVKGPGRGGPPWGLRHPRTPDRGHRAVRSRRGLRRAVPQSLDDPVSPSFHRPGLRPGAGPADRLLGGPRRQGRDDG